jgi:hypothetical protein
MLARLLIPAALVAGSGVAIADPKFEYAKPEDVKVAKGTEKTASAEGGFVFTTGNSETVTVTGGFKASRKTGDNKLAVEASAAYARSSVRTLLDNNGNGTIDDETEITSVESTTAETLAGKIRYDRFLTTSNSMFVAVLASRDVPAGKEAVLGAQAGYSRQLYKSKIAEAVAEAGYDFSRENLVTGPAVSIHSARIFLGYKSEMAPGTNVDLSVEALSNINRETLPTGKDGGFGQDTRVNAKAAVSAKIGKSLAVQMSIEGKYDHRPGPLAIKGLAMGFVPEASTFDSIMKATLIYQIF